MKSASGSQLRYHDRTIEDVTEVRDIRDHIVISTAENADETNHHHPPFHSHPARRRKNRQHANVMLVMGKRSWMTSSTEVIVGLLLADGRTSG